MKRMMKRMTRRMTTSTFVVAMVVAVFSHTHVGYGVEPLPTSTFKQDNFVIGASCWPPFPDNDELDARYREIAEANFTLVIGPMAGDKAKHIKLCGKYNLAAIVDCFRAPFDNLPTSDACWGYRLSDEPATSDFPMLRKQATALRKARPSKLGYINLFPNYADPERQLGSPTYDEYVAKFVEDVDMSKIITAEKIMKKSETIAYYKTDGPKAAYRKMKTAGISKIFVRKDRQLAGIVTASDAGQAMKRGDKTLENILIRDIARVSPDTSAMELFPILTDNEYPIAVVNESNRLQGVILKGLLLGALADSARVYDKD
jgi:CBS domain-containing protein